MDSNEPTEKKLCVRFCKPASTFLFALFETDRIEFSQSFLDAAVEHTTRLFGRQIDTIFSGTHQTSLIKSKSKN